jgi:hypothetical protein
LGDTGTTILTRANIPTRMAIHMIIIITIMALRGIIIRTEAVTIITIKI